MCNSGRCGLLIPSIGSATIISDILICNFFMQDTPFGDFLLGMGKLEKGIPITGRASSFLVIFLYTC